MQFDNFWIVEQFFEYGINNFLTNLGSDLMESLSKFLEILFSNNINIEIAINLLFDDFIGNNIVFLFFLNLDSDSKLCKISIYHIPNLFFFKYSLYKVNSL